MPKRIVLVGGGALIRGLNKLIEKETKIPVYLSEDPLTSVVRGTGIILEDIDQLRVVFVEDESDLPPT